MDTPRQPPRFTRRRFLAAAGLVSGVVAAEALWFEPERVGVSRHDLAVPGLPAALAGLTVAQITDMHLPHNLRAMRHAVALVAREAPDVVVLTGDICETRASLDLLSDFVSRVRGRIATLGTYGNWEHRAGLGSDELRAAYQRAGAGFLVNEATAVTVRGARLGIVGLDDAVMGNPEPRAAVARRVPAAAEIWLLHAPAYADQLGPGLGAPPTCLLSGHTHGGQIRLPGWTPYTPPGSGRYVSGWYRPPFAPLYVSRGVGTVEIDARFFAPPEIPIFTLRPAAP